VQRLAVLNAPHPAVWVEAMRNNPAQKRSSRYVRLFQVPYVPELLIGMNRSEALSKGFRDSLRTGAFTDADLREYRTAWHQRGALTSMINYYRALLEKPLAPAREYRISCPTLIIWGKRDAYAVPELAESSKGLCVKGRIVWLDQATHWVQHDQPVQVTELLSEFLSEGSHEARPPEHSIQ
jgi:pimeloyl-ACP methyl ester carboxylesterase